MGPALADTPKKTAIWGLQSTVAGTAAGRWRVLLQLPSNGASDVRWTLAKNRPKNYQTRHQLEEQFGTWTEISCDPPVPCYCRQVPYPPVLLSGVTKHYQSVCATSLPSDMRRIQEWSCPVPKNPPRTAGRSSWLQKSLECAPCMWCYRRQARSTTMSTQHRQPLPQLQGIFLCGPACLGRCHLQVHLVWCWWP